MKWTEVEGKKRKRERREEGMKKKEKDETRTMREVFFRDDKKIDP